MGAIKIIPTEESLVMLQSPIQLPNGLTRLTLQDKAGFEGSVDVSRGSGQPDASRLPATQRSARWCRWNAAQLASDEVHTRIELQRALSHSYDRSTVTIQGNLALPHTARHGAKSSAAEMRAGPGSASPSSSLP